MSRRRTPATVWRERAGGQLATTLGSHGLSVTLFQKRRNGLFYRSVWLPEARRKDVRSVGTSSPEEALGLGKDLLARLEAGEALSPNRVALGELWRRFSTESRRFLDNTQSSMRDAAARARHLLAYFGTTRNVITLTEDDIAAYRMARLSGLPLGGGRKLAPCRERSVEADLVVLWQMLRWATTRKLASGAPWLTAHPLAGVPRHREANPRRPVATWERFTATLKAIHALRERAQTERERFRWAKVELALVLAEATGRRLGSIRGLQWADFDREAGTIRWRAEHDKKGRDSLIPYPPDLFERVWALRRFLGAAQGWCFPADTDPTRQMDRHLFDKWLTVAEQEAGLLKLEGGLWHPYRRKWATERKSLPIPDVAAAGGWTDVETLLRCYQQPERETLLRVTAEERKLKEAISGS